MKKQLTFIILSTLLTGVYAEGPKEKPQRPDRNEIRKERGMKDRKAHRKPKGNPFERALRMLEKKPEIAKQLGITEEQIGQLKNKRESFKEKTKPLNQKLREAKKAVGKLMGSEDAPESEIMEAVEVAGELEIELKKEEVRLMLEIREILGKEVFQKIQRRTGPHRKDPKKKRTKRAGFQEGDNKPVPPWMKIEP